MSAVAQIVEAEADLADALFLVALVVFGVAAVINALAREIASTLAAAGWAVLSLAWLVL